MDNRNFDVMAGIGAKSREDMFVISLLKRDFEGGNLYPDTKPPDFEKILRIARNNNISQKLYSVLRGRQWDNHSYFMAELRKDYLSTAVRNTLIYSEFKRVIKSFIDKKIDVIAMKGIALAELIYQDIGVRWMSDIDLLIRKEDISRADEVLKNKGYKALDSTSYDGIDITGNYLTTCDYRSENQLHPSFHIHWHIVNSTVPAPYSSRINMDELWRDSVPVEIDGVRVLSMSPHHFLIHLCEHAMRVTHSAAKLIYLLDVSALVERYRETIDWHKVVEFSRNYGLDRFVYNILSLTRLNMGLDVTEWVLERLKPKRTAFGERLFHFITARGKGFSGLSYLVHLSMNKGIFKKISFIFRTVFPPAWVLAKRSSYEPDNQHADKSAAILYLNRLIEVLSHIFSLPIRRFKKTDT